MSIQKFMTILMYNFYFISVSVQLNLCGDESFCNACYNSLLHSLSGKSIRYRIIEQFDRDKTRMTT